MERLQGADPRAARRPVTPGRQPVLSKGNVIKGVNRQKIRSTEDLKRAIRKNESEDDLLLLVQRPKNTFYVVLEG